MSLEGRSINDISFRRNELCTWGQVAFQRLAELNLIWEKRCGRGDANQIYPFLFFLYYYNLTASLTVLQPQIRRFLNRHFGGSGLVEVAGAFPAASPGWDDPAERGEQASRQSGQAHTQLHGLHHGDHFQLHRGERERPDGGSLPEQPPLPAGWEVTPVFLSVQQKYIMAQHGRHATLRDFKF